MATPWTVARRRNPCPITESADDSTDSDRRDLRLIAKCDDRGVDTASRQCVQSGPKTGAESLGPGSVSDQVKVRKSCDSFIPPSPRDYGNRWTTTARLKGFYHVLDQIPFAKPGKDLRTAEPAASAGSEHQPCNRCHRDVVTVTSCPRERLGFPRSPGRALHLSHRAGPVQ